MSQHRKSYGRRARAYAQLGVLALCVASLASGGCYTRSIIPAQNLSRITIPRHGQELVLRDQHGGTVRIGPNSKIRFLVRGGTWTAWIEGRRLHVNRVGACAGVGGAAPELVARWSDIFAAEVRNLSGGKTYGAILATTVAVGVVLVLIAGSAKGGGGKGLGKMFKGLGKGAGRALARGLAHGALYHGFRLGVHLPHVFIAPGAPADPSPGPADPHPPATARAGWRCFAWVRTWTWMPTAGWPCPSAWTWAAATPSSTCG